MVFECFICDSVTKLPIPRLLSATPSRFFFVFVGGVLSLWLYVYTVIVSDSLPPLLSPLSALLLCGPPPSLHLFPFAVSVPRVYV